MLLQSLLKHGTGRIILVIATIMGSFGGFPSPPKVFVDARKYQVVQWFLVFVLAYQGGSGQDVPLALAATFAIMVLYKGIRALENNDADELLL